MGISLDNLYVLLEQRNGFPLNKDQQAAVSAGNGPLLIIAGPGTGKTETLVARCLKLICCDEVDPRSIIVTTYTEKAARSLQQRITGHMAALQESFPSLARINIGQLRIGTLHSIANDILLEYRYHEYRNVRLLDDVESRMFIRRYVVGEVWRSWRDIFSRFGYLSPWYPDIDNVWRNVKVLEQLFNWIVEYRLDLDMMARAGDELTQLVDAYRFYYSKLLEQSKCDFGHLLYFFLRFLSSSQGQVFLKGNPQTGSPPLLHVLVDEYQDTNPIQEDIYFCLAQSEPHNLTVVGDDDQAIYRFRGSTVECMVGFPNRCRSAWGVLPRIIPLRENYRSDERIIKWCDWYVRSFPAMKQPNARLSKPTLVSVRGERGPYPALCFIRARNVPELASRFADMVRGLMVQGTIEDYSQCVLLLRSTRETGAAAGVFVEALRSRGIPVYNPRSKAYAQQPEVRQVLGVLVTVLDPARRVRVPSHVLQWLEEAASIIGQYPALDRYVRKAAEKVTRAPAGAVFAEDYLEVVYRILALPPFSDYRSDPAVDHRLGKLTRLLESFGSIYSRRLVKDEAEPCVGKLWLEWFYEILGGYFSAYGVDDDEDEELVCPRGSFPVMTIHQAKGLEFDFVFVGQLGARCIPRGEHWLQSELHHYSGRGALLATGSDILAVQDEVRLHYVAYSRAKYALVLLVTDSQFRKRDTASFGGLGSVEVGRRFRRL